MTNETFSNYIAEFFKILYPLSSPIVKLEKMASGKYRCLVFMNKVSEPTNPWCRSNHCNSEKLALKQVLKVIEASLQVKFDNDANNAKNCIDFYKAQIKEHELNILTARNNIKYGVNTLRRLRSLKNI